MRAHALASLAGLVIAALFGLLVATKFSLPELFGEHAALSWGRLRMNHTQGVFFGFLGNAAIAFALLRDAAPDRPAGHEPPPGVVPFLSVELRHRAARMVPRFGWYLAAARVGGVSVWSSTRL